MNALHPPGWYADPSTGGQNRYWDGGAWTEHVDDAPRPVPPVASNSDASRAGALGSPARAASGMAHVQTGSRALASRGCLTPVLVVAAWVAFAIVTGIVAIVLSVIAELSRGFGAGERVYSVGASVVAVSVFVAILLVLASVLHSLVSVVRGQRLVDEQRASTAEPPSFDGIQHGQRAEPNAPKSQGVHAGDQGASEPAERWPSDQRSGQPPIATTTQSPAASRPDPGKGLGLAGPAKEVATGRPESPATARGRDLTIWASTRDGTLVAFDPLQGVVATHALAGPAASGPLATQFGTWVVSPRAEKQQIGEGYHWDETGGAVAYCGTTGPTGVEVAEVHCAGQAYGSPVNSGDRLLWPTHNGVAVLDLANRSFVAEMRTERLTGLAPGIERGTALGFSADGIAHLDPSVDRPVPKLVSAIRLHVMAGEIPPVLDGSDTFWFAGFTQGSLALIELDRREVTPRSVFPLGPASSSTTMGQYSHVRHPVPWGDMLVLASDNTGTATFLDRATGKRVREVHLGRGVQQPIVDGENCWIVVRKPEPRLHRLSKGGSSQSIGVGERAWNPTRIGEFICTADFDAGTVTILDVDNWSAKSVRVGPPGCGVVGVAR